MDGCVSPEGGRGVGGLVVLTERRMVGSPYHAAGGGGDKGERERERVISGILESSFDGMT